MPQDREEQIIARLAKLQDSINEWRTEQKALARELEGIETMRSAVSKVAGMGQTERQAIAQLIAEAGSIESGEEVGGLAS